MYIRDPKLDYYVPYMHIPGYIQHIRLNVKRKYTIHIVYLNDYQGTLWSKGLKYLLVSEFLFSRGSDPELINLNPDPILW